MWRPEMLLIEQMAMLFIPALTPVTDFDPGRDKKSNLLGAFSSVRIGPTRLFQRCLQLADKMITLLE